MGLVANGIYGYRVSSGATALGSLPINRKNFATNALTWQNRGGSTYDREKVSYPSGYFAQSFHMALKDGGLSAVNMGTSTLTADTSLAGFLADITANLVGAGTVSSASLAQGINLLATIYGAGTITSPTMLAKAWMEAIIQIGAQPTAFDIAQAVWGSVASQNNTSGTMGQKLNGAGSAGDPWTTDLSAYNTAGTAGKKLKDSLTTGKFLGLK